MVGNKPQKDGEGPVQAPGIEYEPDVWFWLADSVLTVDKTRCDRIAPLSTWAQPGPEFADLLVDWIDDVEDPFEAALAMAIERGKSAAEAKDAAAYKTIRGEFESWCLAHRIPEAKYKAGAERFKAEAVTAGSVTT